MEIDHRAEVGHAPSLPPPALPARKRRSIALLVLGAVAGAALAASGLGAGSSSNSAIALPPDVVARVNGSTIRRDDYERMLGALASDRRGPLEDGDRQMVLDRLIDEELLVQRGIELGLARRDRRVRADITASVIAAVVSEVDGVEPDDEQLERFYEKEREFFTRPGRIAVRQIFFRVPDPKEEPQAERRAREALERLRAGDDFDTVKEALGDLPAIPLPGDFLPPAKLRDYLGPTALRTALGLAVGEVSEPVRSGTGVHLLQVIDRQPDETPELAAIRSEVAAEYRRRAGDDALRAYLNRLREEADVVRITPSP